jgi:hypothetical protein
LVVSGWEDGLGVSVISCWEEAKLAGNGRKRPAPKSLLPGELLDEGAR